MGAQERRRNSQLYSFFSIQHLKSSVKKYFDETAPLNEKEKELFVPSDVTIANSFLPSSRFSKSLKTGRLHIVRKSCHARTT